MIPERNLVVEVCGEGKTDIGHSSEVGPPIAGVVPILLHKLCGKPDRMLVKSRRLMHLEGRTLRKKVWLAKHQAWVNGSNAAVFVIDSDAKPKALPRMRAELEDGRDGGLEEFPMAVGVAQPCIESWLLTDATAIRRGLDLPETPAVPDKPEELAAPNQDRNRNPKTELVRIAGSRTKELSTKEKDSIAGEMNDIRLPRARCPLGFAPFADEVEDRIRPLF